MLTLPTTRRRALALIAAPFAAWILRSWPAAAQQEPEVPTPPPAATDVDKGGETAVEQEKKVTDEVKVEPETKPAPKPEQTPRQARQEKRDSMTGEKAVREKQERKPATRKKAERKKLDRSDYDRRKVR